MQLHITFTRSLGWVIGSNSRDFLCEFGKNLHTYIASYVPEILKSSVLDKLLTGTRASRSTWSCNVNLLYNISQEHLGILLFGAPWPAISALGEMKAAWPPRPTLRLINPYLRYILCYTYVVNFPKLTPGIAWIWAWYWSKWCSRCGVQLHWARSIRAEAARVITKRDSQKMDS